MPTKEFLKDLKLVPPISIKRPEATCECVDKSFVYFPLGIFIAYLILVVGITFLPLTFTLKILGLVIGSFLLFDILLSFKHKIHG